MYIYIYNLLLYLCCFDNGPQAIEVSFDTSQNEIELQK